MDQDGYSLVEIEYRLGEDALEIELAKRKPRCPNSRFETSTETTAIFSFDDELDQLKVMANLTESSLIGLYVINITEVDSISGFKFINEYRLTVDEPTTADSDQTLPVEN